MLFGSTALQWGRNPISINLSSVSKDLQANAVLRGLRKAIPGTRFEPAKMLNLGIYRNCRMHIWNLGIEFQRLSGAFCTWQGVWLFMIKRCHMILFWGDVNKCSLTQHMEPTTVQMKDTTKVRLGEPMSSIRVMCRHIGERWLTGAEKTKGEDITIADGSWKPEP